VFRTQSLESGSANKAREQGREQGLIMEDLTARLNVIDERLHSLLERL
jgi:DNA-binding NtrC family response regulator